MEWVSVKYWLIHSLSISGLEPDPVIESTHLTCVTRSLKITVLMSCNGTLVACYNSGPWYLVVGWSGGTQEENFLRSHWRQFAQTSNSCCLDSITMATHLHDYAFSKTTGVPCSSSLLYLLFWCSTAAKKLQAMERVTLCLGYTMSGAVTW